MFLGVIYKDMKHFSFQAFDRGTTEGPAYLNVPLSFPLLPFLPSMYINTPMPVLYNARKYGYNPTYENRK